MTLKVICIAYVIHTLFVVWVKFANGKSTRIAQLVLCHWSKNSQVLLGNSDAPEELAEHTSRRATFYFFLTTAVLLYLLWKPEVLSRIPNIF